MSTKAAKIAESIVKASQNAPGQTEGVCSATQEPKASPALNGEAHGGISAAARLDRIAAELREVRAMLDKRRGVNE